MAADFFRERIRESRFKLSGERNLHRFALAAVLLFYLIVTTAVSLTKTPICDEGWYADPALNLVKNGSMGSPVIESAGGFLKGIDRYTYWEMPLHIVMQAGWYEVFGASLFSTRALSIVAGLIALICWYVIILKISNDRGLALLVLPFAQVDTMFIALAATGRTDMLSVAFGAAAQASYIVLRTRNFKLALLIAHSFVVASGLTHPIGGLVALTTTLFLYIYLDRERLAFSDVLPIAIPFLVGGLAWGAYIMENPTVFWAQFGGNSAERLWPWKSPLLALKREIVGRFIGGYRIGSSSWTPLANLRFLVLITYLAGLLGVVFRRQLRRSRLASIVLAQTALIFLILWFFEGSKQPWYLIHLVWPFTVALAMSLQWYWQERAAWRPIMALVMLGFACIELGYPALLIAKNNYRNSYCTTIAMLEDPGHKHGSVVGSAELGFGLGFERVLDDHYLGYYTRKEPDFIVLDRNYRGFLDIFRRERPEVYRYAQSLLARRYHEIYSNDYYVVWARVENPITPEGTGDNRNRF